jgi:hypothetical protein
MPPRECRKSLVTCEAVKVHPALCTKSPAMNDRLSTLVISALIGGACIAIAALPHLTAYSALVTWTANLAG